MRQLLRPQLRIAHPAIELLSEEPLPVFVDEIREVIEEIDDFDKVDTRFFSQLPKVRPCPAVVHRVGPVDVWLLRPNNQGGSVDCTRAMGKQKGFIREFRDGIEGKGTLSYLEGLTTFRIGGCFAKRRH